jgi:predicted ribosomally synthesized peptide with SipW-like signal peptide
LWTLLVVGAVGAASGVGTFAALSSTTSNTGNTFSAGTVIIADNDAGAAMLTLTSVAPGASDTSCIRVTYSGSLDSSVRLYGSSTGSLATYLNLTVTRGTDSSPSFDSCANFTADATNYIGAGAGVIYSGTLAAFPGSYAAGIVDPTSGSPETWSTSEAHTYRFVITLADDNAAQALSATASFTWEARNL